MLRLRGARGKVARGLLIARKGGTGSLDFLSSATALCKTTKIAEQIPSYVGLVRAKDTAPSIALLLLLLLYPHIGTVFRTTGHSRAALSSQIAAYHPKQP